jgi:hypothetical protein
MDATLKNLGLTLTRSLAIFPTRSRTKLIKSSLEQLPKIWTGSNPEVLWYKMNVGYETDKGIFLPCLWSEEIVRSTQRRLVLVPPPGSSPQP